MQPLNPGEMRHLVWIQILEEDRDDSTGESVQVATDLEQAYAKIEPLSGRQMELARALIATVTHRITMWYNPELKVNRRIRFGSRVFIINDAKNDEERNYKHILLCTEEVTYS